LRQLLNGRELGGRSIVYLTQAPVGAGVDSPAHSHEGEQLFYIFSGKMTSTSMERSAQRAPAAWWSSLLAACTATGTAGPRKHFSSTSHW
jgi:hypothetical protein